MNDSPASTYKRRPPQEDPMWLHWNEVGAEISDRVNYHSSPFLSRIYNTGHSILEEQYGPRTMFNRVLEVGAGSGVHFPFIKHRFLRYTATDISRSQLDRAKKNAEKINFHPVEFEVTDASSLPYPGARFDRLIAVFTLERLRNPHRVLKEWKRVIAPGGTISITCSTEGGVAWNLCRHLITRPSFTRKGLNLDYISAREHINTCYRLISLIRFYFKNRQEIWLPAKIPNTHLNLLYSVNITVEK